MKCLLRFHSASAACVRFGRKFALQRLFVSLFHNDNEIPQALRSSPLMSLDLWSRMSRPKRRALAIASAVAGNRLSVQVPALDTSHSSWSA